MNLDMLKIRHRKKLVFEADLNSTLERNNQRKGKANIAEVGVRATYKKLEQPSFDEGFNEMYKLKIVGNGEFSVQVLET